MSDKTTIYPADDADAQRLAGLLISLADDPRHVVTNTDSGLAFVVPGYLGDRYLEHAYPTPADSAPRKRTRRKEAD